MHACISFNSFNIHTLTAKEVSCFDSHGCFLRFFKCLSLQGLRPLHSRSTNKLRFLSVVMDLLEKEFQESEMETRIENVSVDNCTRTFFVQGSICTRYLLPYAVA